MDEFEAFTDEGTEPTTVESAIEQRKNLGVIYQYEPGNTRFNKFL